MKVQDVMTREVESLSPESNLAQAATIMWNRDCGIVPIVEHSPRRLVGVLTDRDICIATATRHREPAEVSVGDAMTPEPRTCAPSDDIHVALNTMKQAQVHRLPVVDPEGALVGMLSLNDCILSAAKAERRTDAALTYRDVMDVLRTISTHRDKADLLATTP
jgi:CBS domain-containing protein